MKAVVTLLFVSTLFLVSGSEAQESRPLGLSLDVTNCDAKLDLIILVDGSKSVGGRNFALIKEWIKDLARNFDIEEGHVQIGVVQYSYWNRRRPMWRQRYIKTEIKLGHYKTLENFNRAVDRIRYQGYQTFTAHAIRKIVDYDFQGRNSRHPDAQRVVVLLTDGKATDGRDLSAAIQHAEDDAGAVIFAVGVGEYSLGELMVITRNNRNRIFELETFDELEDVVQELPRILQGACDCYPQGSLSNECDPCTRQCPCKPNVIGRRCDQCAGGSYNMSHPLGCMACDCNTIGTIPSVICDKTSGDCLCKTDVIGEKCDRCLNGHFGFPDCKLCQCNGFSTSCDEETGVCTNCEENRAGNNCETCKPGHYFDGDGVCVPCQCNGHINIDDPEACDVETGECRKCLHNTTGEHCEKCKDDFYRDSVTGQCEALSDLRACDCNRNGTDTSTCYADGCTCNETTGQCTCLPNVVGLKCDDCEDGYWGFVEGCVECRCSPVGSLSTACDKLTGLCECLPGYAGPNCDDCADGYASDIDSCKLCECDEAGTEPDSCDEESICACDSTTSQCECLPGVIGLACSECQDGFTNLTPGIGCQPCSCESAGSVSNICDKETGDCGCLPGYFGRKCQYCDVGYYRSEAGECLACGCNMLGTDKSQCNGERCMCDVSTMQCPCLPGVTGLSCDNCQQGYWGFGTEEGCQRCGCDGLGSLSLTCNKNTGRCECFPGYTGTTCEDCDIGYYRTDESSVCRDCQCNELGTTVSACEDGICECDSDNGQCDCIPNVVGRSCDQCADGYWNFEGGCEPCGCHSSGSEENVCDKSTGQCDCIPGHEGRKCDTCVTGHAKINDEDVCSMCDCDLSGTDKSRCDLGICECDATTGQCPCLPNVEGLMCNECEDGYWNFGRDDGCERCQCHRLGSLSQTCDKGTGECECLPGHTGSNCFECEKGYWRRSLEDRCTECTCDLSGTDPDECEDGGTCACHSVTSQCPCLPGVTGLSCNKCEDKFWGLTQGEGCKPCECDGGGSISLACDKSTGDCRCHPGHAGSKCDQCEHGYYRINPGDKCRECNCNMYGRDPSSCSGGKCACSVANGQCSCLPNVAGLSCNRCEEGYWNIRSMTGCEPCNCDKTGSNFTSCDEKSGRCQCHKGYAGNRCEKCDRDYARSDPKGICKVNFLNEGTTTTPRTTTTTTTTKKVITVPRPFSTYPPIITRPPYRPRTTKKPTCYRCRWPSYCHGWMCRRRWPHHKFRPSHRRCGYGHTTCQHAVANSHGYYGSRRTTAAPRPKPTSRSYYGYNLYGTAGFRYKYYPRNSYSRSRSYSRSNSRSNSGPISYGLYRSLYRGRK